jgi:TPP-dependent 2-oxoacid decarboxylase
MTTISIGKYLIHRLKEVGIETIFGVPGDYNMVKKLSKSLLAKSTASTYRCLHFVSLYILAFVGPNRR